MLAWLDAGDPEGEVGAAYLAKELLRETYLAGDALEARRRLVAFYDHCTNSSVAELDRLARTIARWETPILRWHRTRRRVEHRLDVVPPSGRSGRLVRDGLVGGPRFG